MPVTYDQPGPRYNHQGVTYDGVIYTVNDGNSRPTTGGAANSRPSNVGGASAPTLGAYASRPTATANTSAPTIGAYSSRPETT